MVLSLVRSTDHTSPFAGSSTCRSTGALMSEITIVAEVVTKPAPMTPNNHKCLCLEAMSHERWSNLQSGRYEHFRYEVVAWIRSLAMPLMQSGGDVTCGSAETFHR